MDILVSVIAGSFLFGVTFWLSIKLLEPSNQNNSLIFAIIFGVAVVACGAFGGVTFGALSIIGIFYLLIKFYDMGLIKSVLVVTISSALSNLFVAFFEKVFPH